MQRKKTLYTVRHAKSGHESPGQTDFDRALNDQGKIDIMNMSKRLRSAKISPDLIITSPAIRALETALLLASELKYPKDQITEDPTIYEASVYDLTKIIKQIDDRFSNVMLIGHNPGIQQLINLLGNKGVTFVPSGTVAKLELPIESWKICDPGIAELHNTFYP